MLLTEDQKEFLYNCDIILTKYGKETENIILGKSCKCNYYVDDVIEIIKSLDGFDMEIVRCSENLPIIYKQLNNYILFHHNYVYLEQHIMHLIQRA